jgi:hypothetical protein
MDRVRLGRTGIEVARIGFGGIPIQRLAVEESDRVLERALDLGINFFDTARIYTDSEAKLGRVLSRRRQAAVIASKTFSRDAAGAERDLHASLKDLRCGEIDLYQLHNVASESDLAKVIGPGGALSALDRAQRDGKVRHIGISGHKPWIVEKALSAFPFATIQVPCNYLETGALSALLPRARGLDIGTIAMKPIGGGNIRALAANFRFIFASGIDVAIPGMDDAAQVEQNVSLLRDLGRPTQEDLAALEEEKARLGDRFCRRCEYCLPCPQGLPIAFLHVLKNYYFLYDLKDWVWERLAGLAKSFSDCVACRQCVERCPYKLETPEIFAQTWEAILKDRESRG